MKACLRVWLPALIVGAVVVLATGVQFRPVIDCAIDGGTWIGGMTRAAYCVEGRAP